MIELTLSIKGIHPQEHQCAKHVAVGKCVSTAHQFSYIKFEIKISNLEAIIHILTNLSHSMHVNYQYTNVYYNDYVKIEIKEKKSKGTSLETEDLALKKDHALIILTFQLVIFIYCTGNKVLQKQYSKLTKPI